jgi:hypothetical protein
MIFNKVCLKPTIQKGVGEKREVFPVEETTEPPKAARGQKPRVSEEQSRVYLVERLRIVGFFAVSMLQPIYGSLGNL